MKWNLNFISQADYKKHVKQYFSLINSETQATDLKEFNKNIIDPIKLTFSFFVSGENIEHIIDAEIARQVDKSINNHIGFFHQNLFKYIDGWHVPKEKFDIVNDEETIFVELKNKHNTMNSSSAQNTYIKMQDKIIEALNAGKEVTCMLVEVIARRNQDIKWQINIEGESTSKEAIRRVSIDKFYEIATGDPYAFRKIVSWLPITLKNIIVEENPEIENTAIIEALTKEKSFFRSLYGLAFDSYQGFDNFNFVGLDVLGDKFY